MLRTIIWFIWFWISLILSMPALLWAKLLDKQNNNEKRIKVVHKVTSLWTRLLIGLSGSKIKVIGEENLPEGPVLYVSNHQSNFDIPILMTYVNRPKGFIAKIELTKMPMVVSWMRQMKCVFMDRKDIRQSINCINEGAQYLKEGYSMVVFPEGTRSGGEQMGEFKAGSFKLALKSGVPVIPVAIDGSYKIMGKKSLIIMPAKVTVNILKPIITSELSKEESKELPNRVQNLIKAALEK